MSKKTKNTKSIKPPSHRGQAMMEYLMTYGLALIVILIVLAILVAVVLPNLTPPETCRFTQPQFDCSAKQASIVSYDTSNHIKLLFQLNDNSGHGVIITNVLCSNKPVADILETDVNPTSTAITPYTMPAGSSLVLGNGAPAPQIHCMDLETSSTPTQLVLKPNSQFTGSVAIIYRYVDEVTGAPPRMATATVTGTVVSG